MALKPPPSPTMASRLFAKLSRITIAPVNLKTSVPRCSAYAYDHTNIGMEDGELFLGGDLSDVLAATGRMRRKMPIDGLAGCFCNRAA
jgi:hypothetical protein